MVDECIGGRQSDLSCYSLRRSAGGGQLQWFETGSGEEYGLVLVGDQALLWVFDHECPYSPWIREDGAKDWPGMLEGLPAALAVHLPEQVPDEARSVSGCYWYTCGDWRMGSPELAVDEAGWADPQGAEWLTRPLRDVEAGAAELVSEYYQRVDLVPAASALVRRVDAQETLAEDAIGALEPKDGITAMVARARELGLSA